MSIYISITEAIISKRRYRNDLLNDDIEATVSKRSSWSYKLESITVSVYTEAIYIWCMNAHTKTQASTYSYAWWQSVCSEAYEPSPACRWPPVDVSIKILQEFFYNNLSKSCKSPRLTWQEFNDSYKLYKYLLRFIVRYTIYLKDIQVPAKSSCKINNTYFIELVIYASTCYNIL